MDVLTGVQKVIYPNDASSQMNVDEAIQIHWPNVEGSAFHLCVGTDCGKWDILTEDVGESRQHVVNRSDVPTSVKAIYVQLITIAEKPRKKDGEIIKIGTVGEIIKINMVGVPTATIGLSIR